jgi:hypothetical protein
MENCNCTERFKEETGVECFGQHYADCPVLEKLVANALQDENAHIENTN